MKIRNIGKIEKKTKDNIIIEYPTIRSSISNTLWLIAVTIVTGVAIAYYDKLCVFVERIIASFIS